MGFFFVCFVRTVQMLTTAQPAAQAKPAVEVIIPALHIQPTELVERTGE